MSLEENAGVPKFSFGDPCPPISSFVFPYETKENPNEIKEKDEQDDAPQPSGG